MRDTLDAELSQPNQAYSSSYRYSSSRSFDVRITCSTLSCQHLCLNYCDSYDSHYLNWLSLYLPTLPTIYSVRKGWMLQQLQAIMMQPTAISRGVKTKLSQVLQESRTSTLQVLKIGVLILETGLRSTIVLIKSKGMDIQSSKFRSRSKTDSAEQIAVFRSSNLSRWISFSPKLFISSMNLFVRLLLFISVSYTLHASIIELAQISSRSQTKQLCLQKKLLARQMAVAVKVQEILSYLASSQMSCALAFMSLRKLEWVMPWRQLTLLKTYSLLIYFMNKTSLQISISSSFSVLPEFIDGNYQFISQEIGVYLLNGIIVLKDIRNTGLQRFIVREGRFHNVTALTHYFKNDKRDEPYLVIAESSLGEESGKICVINIFNEKTKLVNSGKGLILQVMARFQGKEIGWVKNCQGSLSFLLYNMEKSNYLVNSTLKSSVQKVLFSRNRESSKSIFLMSSSFFRIWKFNSTDQLKEGHNQPVPLSLQKKLKFFDMCWNEVNKQFYMYVLALQTQTVSQKVFVVLNEQILKTLDINGEDGEGLPSERGFKAIVGLKKSGFILGGHSILSFFYLEKNFSLINTQNIEFKSQGLLIKSIYVTDSQELISFVASSKAKSQFSPYYINNFDINSQEDLQSMYPLGYHCSKILSVAHCISKSIFASISDDNQLRIWSYALQKEIKLQEKCLVNHNLPRTPSMISLHPSGDFVAVALRSSFKVLAILKKQLYLIKEIHLLNCNIIRYSRFGHYFITNEKENLHIFDSYYFNQLVIITFPSTISSGFISTDDVTLVIGTVDNRYYHQPYHKNTKNSTVHSVQACHSQPDQYLSFVYEQWRTSQGQQSLQSDLFAGCTPKKYLVLYKNKCSELISEFAPTDCRSTQLAIASQLRALVVGTDTGKVRFYSWPILETQLQTKQISPTQVKYQLPTPIIQFSISVSTITALSINFQNNYLTVGRSDGSVLGLEVKRWVKEEERELDKESIELEQNRKRIKTIMNRHIYFLISKHQQKRNTIATLKEQLASAEQKLKLQKEKIIRASQSFRLKKIATVTSQTRQIKQSTDISVEKLIKEEAYLQSQLQLCANSTKQRLEHHSELFKKKMLFQEQRDRDLLQQQKDMIFDYARLTELLLKRNKRKCDNLKQLKSKEIKSLELRLSSIKQELSKDSKILVEKLDREDSQLAFQIEKSIDQRADLVKSRKNQINQLQLKSADLKQKYQGLKKENEQLKKEIQQLIKQESRMRMTHIDMDSELLKMRHQILQRKQVLQNKDQLYKQSLLQMQNYNNLKYLIQIKSCEIKTRNDELSVAINEEQMKDGDTVQFLLKEEEQIQNANKLIKNINRFIEVVEKDCRTYQTQIQLTKNKRTSIVSSLKSLTLHTFKPWELTQLIRDILANKKLRQNLSLQRQQGQSDQVHAAIRNQRIWAKNKSRLMKNFTEKNKIKDQIKIETVLNENIQLLGECKRMRDEQSLLWQAIKRVNYKLAQISRSGEQKEQQVLNLQKLSRLQKQNEEKLLCQKGMIESMKNQLRDLKINDIFF